MRIAAVYNPRLPNSNYRARIPLRELERRGHEVLWPDEVVGDRIGRLLDCDAVHLHRQYGPATLAVGPLLARSGVAVVCDNDDDLSSVPVESPHYEAFSGDRGRQVEDALRRILRRAAMVTTPSPVLADRFAEAGADEVRVIENHLPEEFLGATRREHEGIVIGWIAGTTHAADSERLGIGEVLARLLETHGEVHVATIGLDLQIGHERYHHLPRVDFERLVDAAAAFDIGIAPLADIDFNRARSNVKLKEYAALGIPWLASPVGPYRGLGSDQGGELVGDTDWRWAIEHLIGDPAERDRRAERARTWAEENSIQAGAGEWEEAFAAAVERARGG